MLKMLFYCVDDFEDFWFGVMHEVNCLLLPTGTRWNYLDEALVSIEASMFLVAYHALWDVGTMTELYYYGYKANCCER